MLENLAQMQPGDQAATMKQSIDEINRLLKELDAMVLGLNVDEKLATGAMEISITAKPGTKTAAQIAKGGAVKTEFGGFFTPASAAGFQFAEVVGKDDLPQTRAAVENFRKTTLKGLEDQGLSEDELKPAKQLVDGLMDVLLKTVESGKLEGGATLSLDPQAVARSPAANWPTASNSKRCSSNWSICSTKKSRRSPKASSSTPRPAMRCV